MSEPASPDRDDRPAGTRAAQTPEVCVRQLVKDHYQLLYRYAYRLTGNIADAEDLTQQTFLSAQEKLHQLRDAAAARSWMFQILRRLFLKSCRQRGAKNEADLQMQMAHVAVETEFDERLDKQYLQQKLNELPDHFRLALLMYYFEGKSYESIAKELSIPQGTVMSRLSRAKTQLRSRLKSLEATK